MPPRRKSNNAPQATKASEESQETEDQDLDNAFEDEQEETAPPEPAKEKESSEPVPEGVFDADLTETERFARAAATLNGKVYQFPYNKPDSLQVSLALGGQFVPENLLPGQIVTVNLQKNGMLIWKELGITLNASNPHYTVPEDASESLKIFITKAILTGGVWLGKFEVTKKPLAVATSTIDQKEFLDKPIRELREDLRELIGKGTRVLDDGTVVSPAIDIKALLEYERSNQNRKDYTDLLRRALNKIHGAVEFIDKMTDVKPVGEAPKGETLPPPGPANPNAVKNFM